MTKPLGFIAGLGFVLAVIFFALAATFSPTTLRGIGRAGAATPSKPGTKEFAWDGGDRLQIDLPASVTLMPGGTPGVTVRGDQDLLDQISLDHGKLSGDDLGDCFIPFFCPARGRHTIAVELHSVQLRELRINGVAQVDMGHLDQDRLTVRLSGAGKVEGEGRLDDLDVSISGAGDASFGGLAVGRARVTLSGVGNAEISPSQEADVTISGVGNVRLDTRPANLIQHVSGVGSISGPGSEKSRGEDSARPNPPQPPEPPRHRGDDLGRQIRDQVREQTKEAAKQAKAQAKQQVDEALGQQGLR